ncbi:DUF1697 domain-containing protein [Maribacter sp. PR1]|uniref:DUF1697 domain-containing protein n=1 Tax=Maribacter cobaltidurans TaxID=1178778 RepID=A0ABU7IRT1_9FLAO|nr:MULTISPECIES: DUF1697 domain-containing protein [Maribacter]MDC6388280.1 DUF1697 domain-containing protein [Maribacter sp. PR1]MEE1975669.1 DUF1697 domain-containing protein [Maribacter cobaltidurans]
MSRYIAFLRGINVSGQKKVPMVELRSIMSNIGLEEVKTYIQSGNVIFTSKRTLISKLEEQIEKAIKKNFGFDVPVLVKSVEDLQKILKNNPFDDGDNLAVNKIYFVLLFQNPGLEKINAFKNEVFPSEKWEFNNNCIYLCCENGYGKAKLNNNMIERKLKVDATTRNYRTMHKLIEMGIN